MDDQYGVGVERVHRRVVRVRDISGATAALVA
jgi:hypothetical protein